MLERLGYEVAAFTNGKQAIRFHKKQPVDLVITDIIMPEKEGIEIIIQLRREFPDVKIIAISGGGRTTPQLYLEMAKTLGADRAFFKPFERKEMLEAIKELVDDDIEGRPSG
ncbi:MAG: response regulator [bacterium]